MDYFNGFLPNLGVTPETLETIEAAYLELLDALDIHFQHYPYILGGRPSIADVGLMAPLYAHLARDPVPSALMKNVAPNVFRWTERMNLANVADGEFWACPEEWFPDDAIPETLETVLKLIFQDWGPELLANAAFYNEWIQANSDLPAGHLVSNKDDRIVHPTLGFIEYIWRDCTVRRASAPHSLWHFAKAQTAARALEGEAARRFADLVDRCGGRKMMDIKLARPMEHRDYVLVLGRA
jgi:hypothetical protein